MDCIFGAAVRRLISAGSAMKLFRMSSLEVSFVWGEGYVTRFLAPRSMPARETSLFSRRMRVVMAGREYKFSPCRRSIMFPARLNDRREYNDDNTEGISINKLADKSSEMRFAASGVHAGAVKVCSEQSDKQRYLRHCHLSSARECKFETDDDSEEFDAMLLDRSTLP
jgi:hypothetical protein